MTHLANRDTLYRKSHRACRGNAPPSCLRKTALPLKSPTGAFIATLRSANAVAPNAKLKIIFPLKLRKAKQLLIESSMSVKEICYELNYTSTEHFFSVFKKRTNFTPTEYRNFGRGGKEKENENE